MTQPAAARVVVAPRGPLCGPGSKGSEGSARLQRAGSKGGGIALRAMNYEVSVTGFCFVSQVVYEGVLETLPLEGRSPAEGF